VRIRHHSRARGSNRRYTDSTSSRFMIGYVNGAGMPRPRRNVVSVYLSLQRLMTDLLGRNVRHPSLSRIDETFSTPESVVGTRRSIRSASIICRNTLP
jgi:hypothetical protein